MGCMMEHLGCVGTQAVGDCNIRGWNGGSSCTRAGYACINCTAPEFEEASHPFSETPKFAGIPVGLPSDMPKAWFMALATAIMHGIENLCDHLTHFNLFFCADFARPAYAGRS